MRNEVVDTLREAGMCEQPSDESTQEFQSPHVVAGLVFAGLYPNVARIDAPKAVTDKVPLISSGGEELKLHLGSLCHGHIDGLHRSNYRWACYHMRMKTSQVFLRDCTFLAPNALVLFGGETSALNIYSKEKIVTIGAGKERHWMSVRLAPRHAVLLRQLRYAFDALLRRKTSDKRPFTAEDHAVIAAYVAVMNSVELDA